MIIARTVWGASPKSLPPTAMRLPAVRVWIHHSVTNVSTDPYADMRAIERVGLQRFNQFPYSYCVHPRDGEILEGCGIRRGAHTAGQNSTSFGICWIGNYEERVPKAQQFDATRWLIAELVRRGHLAAGAPIGGHRDTGFATLCPGSKLHSMLDMIRRPWEAPKGVAPMHDPALDLEPIVADLACPTGGAWLLAASGAVYAFGGAPFLGAPNGKDYFRGRVAARLEAVNDAYCVVAESGEKYGPGF